MDSANIKSLDECVGAFGKMTGANSTMVEGVLVKVVINNSHEVIYELAKTEEVFDPIRNNWYNKALMEATVRPFPFKPKKNKTPLILSGAFLLTGVLMWIFLM